MNQFLLAVWSCIQLTYCCAKFRSSHQRCSIRKGVLRNFVKFTGKHLCQSRFFSPNAGKYGPEKAPYLVTFHAVKERPLQTVTRLLCFCSSQNYYYVVLFLLIRKTALLLTYLFTYLLASFRLYFLIIINSIYNKILLNVHWKFVHNNTQIHCYFFI